MIHLLLLQVNYKSGLPELYLLPLMILKASQAGLLLRDHPEAILAEISSENEDGILCDAFYITEMHQWLFSELARAKKPSAQKDHLVFSSDPLVRKYFHQHPQPHSRILLTSDQNNSAITFNNRFFLKVYRKVEPGQHPDLEISRYLTRDARFAYSPAYLGSAALKLQRDSFPLLMLQDMVENHGNGYSYMQERLFSYSERVLSLKKPELFHGKLAGSFKEPQDFEAFPTDVKTLLSPRAAAEVMLIGKRIGEMHLTLGNGKEKEFLPEKFTLHYQRSLYAAIHPAFREAFNSLARNIKKLPRQFQDEASELLARKNEYSDMLKRIYQKKIDTLKIRIHGNLNLQQILLTGKDIAIHDFGGNPTRTLSERRLKRSCLRDVASMIRSFYYISYESILEHSTPNEVNQQLLPFTGYWTQVMSSIFIKSYLDVMGNSGLIPKLKEHFEILIDTYLLEKAFYSLIEELDKRPGHAIIPIRIISSTRG
jgi:maltose alpha-D-glucosyltransferase/alpha-amylase